MDLVSLATIPRDSALARRRQQFYTFMGGMVLSDPPWETNPGIEERTRGF